MSVYCISDIHGRYNEFIDLLEKVEFDKEKDKLYVLGDLVDWGNKSVEVINYCMENKDCIEVIIGNHDYMMMAFFKENPYYFETGVYKYSNWFNNDGHITLEQLKDIGKEKTNTILEWFNSLKYAAEGFNPNIGFKRTKTLMQGDDCCDHFYYYKDKSKQCQRLR